MPAATSLPTNRTSASTTAEHTADHDTAHGAINDLTLYSPVVVRWTGTAWPARPAWALFGVVFLSTNDPAATAPPSSLGLLVGDIWRLHPNAP